MKIKTTYDDEAKREALILACGLMAYRLSFIRKLPESGINLADSLLRSYPRGEPGLDAIGNSLDYGVAQEWSALLLEEGLDLSVSNLNEAWEYVWNFKGGSFTNKKTAFPGPFRQEEFQQTHSRPFRKLTE